jgi:hypothetical protein
MLSLIGAATSEPPMPTYATPAGNKLPTRYSRRHVDMTMNAALV